jgi:hypothetical protein
MVKRAFFRCLSISAKQNPGDATVASFVLQGITVWMVFFFAESVFKMAQLMSMNILLLAAAAGLPLPAIRRTGRSVSGNSEERRPSEPGKSEPASARERIVTDPDLQL